MSNLIGHRQPSIGAWLWQDNWALTAGRRARANQQPMVASGCGLIPSPSCFVPFFEKIYFYFRFFGSFGNVLGLLGEWVYSTPIFLPLHLEVLNVPHGNWRFYFSKFRIYLDLYIYSWNFCFMKN